MNFLYIAGRRSTSDEQIGMDKLKANYSHVLLSKSSFDFARSAKIVSS